MNSTHCAFVAALFRQRADRGSDGRLGGCGRGVGGHSSSGRRRGTRVRLRGARLLLQHPQAFRPTARHHVPEVGVILGDVRDDAEFVRHRVIHHILGVGACLNKKKKIYRQNHFSESNFAGPKKPFLSIYYVFFFISFHAKLSMIVLNPLNLAVPYVYTVIQYNQHTGCKYYSHLFARSLTQPRPSLWESERLMLEIKLF